ncbi:MAG TPA: lipid-A-disaccharide synthase N-terminal domain-containing protein [Tepidisphaeraceae bacterium]|nr:lipid-A-disaccharide synthase N-terminal domain-containing protein [Tepidisphaeraceae bacterium]
MTIDTLLPQLTHFRMPFQNNYVLWKIIGFTGILTFGSRFIVQWLYSEKHKESKIPPIFWWQSMIGTVLCLAYSLRQQESVFIAGYLFNLIPYIRNLMLIRSKKRSDRESAGVASEAPAPAPSPALLSSARIPS